MDKRTPARASIARVERDGKRGGGRAADASRDQATEKLLPQNVEAEAAVLGCILIDAAAMARLDFLRSEDFYREAHRQIFTAMCDLFLADSLVGEGGSTDYLTLTDELRRRGTLEDVGGASYVWSLAQQAPSSLSATRYARIVQRTAVLRRLIDAAGQIAGVAYNEPDAEHAVAQAEQLVAELRADWERRAEAGDARPPEQLGIDGQDLLGLDLPEPRWIIPSLLAEGLTLLVGKPKGGKTWMAISLALALITAGMALGVTPVERTEVLYLALEDQPRRFKSRLMLLLAGAPMPRGLRVEWRWPRLDEGGLRKLERYLDEHPATRCVFVDTWVKVRGADDEGKGVYRNDYDALDGLRELAARQGVAVVLVHHKNKRLEGGDPLDSVSGSNGVAGGVDNLLILHRERGANEGTLHTTGRDVDDRELALRFDPAHGAWRLLGDAETYRVSREREELLSALADAPPDGLTIQEAAEAARWEYRRAKLMLWRMERDGDVVKRGRGCYALATAQLARMAKPRNTETPETGEPLAGHEESEESERWIARPADSAAPPSSVPPFRGSSVSAHESQGGHANGAGPGGNGRAGPLPPYPPRDLRNEDWSGWDSAGSGSDVDG